MDLHVFMKLVNSDRMSFKVILLAINLCTLKVNDYNRLEHYEKTIEN